MKCKDCLYCYADVDEEGNPTGYEYCHYFNDDGYAPCEVDDNEAEREPELDEYD